ncbi:phosphatidate cytidylyltransferase [[Mycoplasma] collis]|uniref:phosphatidate cytidylyltransferase n=1 Tax=[Mycoplasma] collis TaxID=2127 RepID=UPI00068F14C1|nr:phosphatidate cytidylyltransferase [[Mycoplasma] collis]
MKNFFYNLNTTSKRIIIALIILAFFIPIFTLPFYGGFFGKIIFSTFCILFCIYGIFEIVRHLEKNKILVFIFSFLPIIIFFVKKDNILEFSKNSQSFKNFVQYLKFDYIEFLTLILYTLSINFLFFIFKNKNQIKKIKLFLILNFAILFIPISAKFLILTTLYKTELAFLFIFLSAISDTFGYFGGKFFGNKFIKQKLAPKISPKKTWEGFIFSYLGSFSFIFFILFFSPIFNDINNKNIYIWIFVFILPIISVVGDLAFSYIKRKLKIKDFSNLFSNHGGLLDRFDSTLFIFFAANILFILIA